MARAGIALGSNVGDRLENLRAARERLRRLHDGDPKGFLVSTLFETAPVGCGPDAAPFYNAVIELETPLSPHALLAAAQSIEHNLGRPSRRPKNAPRTIDVDLLYLGGTIVVDAALELPHPRLLLRRFVLTPLAAIRPDLRLPGNHRTIAECLAEMETDEALPAPVATVW